jgi:hypothetical protein
LGTECIVASRETSYQPSVISRQENLVAADIDWSNSSAQRSGLGDFCLMPGEGGFPDA